MSRSGYSDDLDNWQLIRWRGRVASAVRGKRGQKLLRDLKSALEALPEKRLVSHELETADGAVCALGALGRVRGLDVKSIDPEDPDMVASTFDIATCLAQEIVYENDEGAWSETPEQRYARMLNWVTASIKEAPSDA